MDAPSEVWLIKAVPVDLSRPEALLGEGTIWARTREEAERIIARYGGASQSFETVQVTAK